MGNISGRALKKVYTWGICFQGICRRCGVKRLKKPVKKMRATFGTLLASIGNKGGTRALSDAWEVSEWKDSLFLP
jgi:hypothetical protein